MNFKKRFYRTAFILIIAAGMLAMYFIGKGVFMKISYHSYEGQGFAFDYPKDWILRESRGTQEKYFQVHVFGKIDPSVGFGPSLTITVYPKKEAGGPYLSLEELIQKKNQAGHLLKGFSMTPQEDLRIAETFTGRQQESSFMLRLPLYKVNSRDVALKEKTVFFEKNNEFFVISYKNIAEDFPNAEKIFEVLIRSFRFVS